MKGYLRDDSKYQSNNKIRLFKLFINFWIIIVLFILIIGPIIGKSDIYPGSWKLFILNITAISPSYNGAWWFLTTYIVLLISSEFINQLVIKRNPWVIISLSFLIYFIAYIQRIKTPLVFDSVFINWILRQIALWGTSQLPFIVGGVFAKYELYFKIVQRVKGLKLKNIWCCLGICLLIIIHGIIQTLFIAVFTGITFICLFNMMKKPYWLERILLIFGEHSTNIWLIHMFFYMNYFKEAIYSLQNPIFIFSFLLLVSLGSSCIIQFIFNTIWRCLHLKIIKSLKTSLSK